MATYNFGVDYPFKAAVDLSNYQYRFVSAGSVSGEVTLAALGASVLGVLQNDPVAGEEATVRWFGSTKVMANAGSAITYGGLLKSGSDGMAWGYASPTASVYAAGVAMEALSSGSGVIIEAFLLPYTRV